MSEVITVGTANTYNGRMLRDPNGLAPFHKTGVDTLLMQEVLDMDADRLDQRLQQDGYRLAHLFGAAGLAIAVRSGSGVRPLPETAEDAVLQPRGRFARFHGGLGC